MNEREAGQPNRFEHYLVATDAQGRPVKLGEGAMGVTYLAEDTNLRVKVALKVIRQNLLGDEEVAQRFQREAQAAARLRHANVAAVYHLGTMDSSFFYAMEFVEGETVKDRVQRLGPLPLKEALEITLQVCEALGAAEKHKMVHRDIKPANIMIEPVDDDAVRVKLIDFGLAKALHADVQNSVALQTQAGIFLGTPVFASPEQVQDISPDSRSDFYSLGLTLWFMLEARTPFEGSLHKVLFDQVHTSPPLGRLLWIPGEVRDLLGKMLEKDPANRPQTAKELRQKIHDCLRALSTAGTSYTEWQQRFQVGGAPRSQPWGMIYEGQDTLSGAVRLHLLRNDRFTDPKAVQNVIADARRAIDLHHPNILRHLTVFPTSGAQGAGWMVVTEHPGTQTLLDHLRKVKQIPPDEVAALMERLASAIDTCVASDLMTADLDPAGIFLKQVPSTEMLVISEVGSPTQTQTHTAVVSHATEKFEVVPKLSPINYSYLSTLQPADETAIGMTRGGFRPEPQTPQELVQRLAILAYQCMGGSIPSTWVRTPRFIPLACLSQKQNESIRAAITDSTWTRAVDFVESFQQQGRSSSRKVAADGSSTSSSHGGTSVGAASTTEATVKLTSWALLAGLAAQDTSELEGGEGEIVTGRIEKKEEATPAPETDHADRAAASAPESVEVQAAATETPAPDVPLEQLEDGVPAGAAAAGPVEPPLAPPRAVPPPLPVHVPVTLAPPEEPAPEVPVSESAITPPPLSEEREEVWDKNEGVGTTPAPLEEAPAATSTPAPAETGNLPVDDALLEPAAAMDSAGKIEVEEAVTEAPPEADAPDIAAPSVTEAEAEVEAAVETLPEPAAASALAAPPLPSPPPQASVQPSPPPLSPVAATSPVAASSLLPPVVRPQPVFALPPASAPVPAATAASPAISPPPPRLPGPPAASPAPLPDRTKEPTPSPGPQQTLRDKLSALPRWALPAAAVAVLLILVGGIAALSGDGDEKKDGNEVVKNQVEPVPPVVVVPPPPTVDALLTTATSAVKQGDLPKLEAAWEEIRSRFPNRAWESSQAAEPFRVALVGAYKEKKLGDGVKSVRRFHDAFHSAAMARNSDLAFLRQVATDLGGDADASLAEPFEKAWLNVLANDPAKKKERMDDALALAAKRPGGEVATVARRILSRELEDSVDYIEQNPRDPSQNEALKNALTALMPRMQKIADAGVAEAWYILGDDAAKNGRLVAAMEYFEKAAGLGHAASMRRYGVALTNVFPGHTPDWVSATYWLKLAAKSSDIKAHVFLADIYLPDIPSPERPREVKEAYDHLMAAIAKGLPEAHHLMGTELLESNRVGGKNDFAPQIKEPERGQKALEHLRKAVDAKFPNAYPDLAFALLTVRNAEGKKDIAGAIKVLEDGGNLTPPNPNCFLRLAAIYNPGLLGSPVTRQELIAADVTPNIDRSDRYFERAKAIFIEAAKRNKLDAVRWCEENNVPYN